MHMNKSLTEIFAIVKELLAVYQPLVGKKLSTTEALAAAGSILGILNKHQVTIADLEGILKEVGPLVSLFGLSK
jgi:hypothetical protein